MKITVYTITDCKYSQAEKQYLQEKNMPFEEKNLEANREFLSEMLTLSNNFAGTPVTKIEKDDGQVVVLKGFTKEEFDKALTASPSPQVASTTSAPKIEEVIEPAPAQKPADAMPASMPPKVEPTMPPAPSMNPPQPSVQTQTPPMAEKPVEPMTPPPAQPPMNQPMQPPVQAPQQPVAMNNPAPVETPMPQQPMQPPSIPQQPAPMDQNTQPPITPSPVQTAPQGEEALSSVLQDLQSRSGDDKPQS